MSATILALWPDLEPAPRPLPRPRTPGLRLVPTGTPLWLPGLAPPEPPPPPARRPRVVAPPGQLALPFTGRRVLTLFPDLLAATRGLCLAQQDECSETDCRHHLGAVRTYLGASFGCAVAVASAYPHGLAPVAVAALMGIDESTAQVTERGAFGKVRVKFMQDRAAEWAMMQRARERAEAEARRRGQMTIAQLTADRMALRSHLTRCSPV